MTEFEPIDDLLLFAPEQEKLEEHAANFWNVLIVDDEGSVHEVTQFALKGFVFEGRNLNFYSVYSAAEAIALLKTKAQEFHAIMLDIVMEHRNAGLDVITFLRNELKDNLVQILVRTGNPGLAPEDYLIHHYEINDYKEKNTLTTQRLKTSLTTGLRNYRNIQGIQQTVIQKLEELEALRHTLRQITFAPELKHTAAVNPATLTFLPFFLRQPPQNKSSLVTSIPNLAKMPDVGLTIPFIQGKIASTSRKAIAIFDYNTLNYRYVSDNMEEITGFSWNALMHKFMQEGHYSPDMHKIDKISKKLEKVYAETSKSEKEQFIAIFDYRITPVAPQNIRILEYSTPLLFNDQGDLLLSLHIFSNINHLKKTDANSILSLHTPNQHQYFSVSDYRMDEIFFGQREQEIMDYSDKNLLSKEIVQQINLSVHTVDTHLRNLRDRFGVTSTNALISYCKEISHLFRN
jgi:DNA-binding NarL/FixJ family response regulator